MNKTTNKPYATRMAYDDSLTCHECGRHIERGDDYLHVFSRHVGFVGKISVVPEDYCHECGELWKESDER
jgi:hypothetical protein